MQNTENKEIWTALYARLSMDDGNVGESMSIGSQKAILKRKAEEMGIHSYKFYMDDGYSGTNFNRPSFQQMIADIEAGHISKYFSQTTMCDISLSMTVWIRRTTERWILPRSRTS